MPFPGSSAVVPSLKECFRPLPILVLIERLVPDELHVLAEADADLSVDIEDAQDADGLFFVALTYQQRRPLHKWK